MRSQRKHEPNSSAERLVQREQRMSSATSKQRAGPLPTKASLGEAYRASDRVQTKASQQERMARESQRSQSIGQEAVGVLQVGGQ